MNPVMAENVVPETEIIRAGKAQLAAILQMDRLCFEAEPWSEKFWLGLLDNAHRYRIWLLRTQDSHEVIGYSVFSCVLDEGELLRIGIAPSWRGRHLGGVLLSNVQTLLFEDGIELLFLEVRKSNICAQTLYGRLGWKRQGVRRNYYTAADGFEDALLFALGRN